MTIDLKNHLSNHFSSEGKVGVSRPVKIAAVGISGLYISVTRSESPAAVEGTDVFVSGDKKRG